MNKSPNRANRSKSKFWNQPGRISNYSFAGLVTGLCAAFIIHGRVVESVVMVRIDDLILATIACIAPVVAIVLSVIGLREANRSELSQKIAFAGLIVGIASLLIAGLFVYAIFADSSLLGIYDGLFDAFNSFDNFFPEF